MKCFACGTEPIGEPWECKCGGTRLPPVRVEAVVGCPVCSGKLTAIRGKYPGDPQRHVCPTCLQERMDMIRDMSNPDYGVGSTANASLDPLERKES